MSKPDEKVILSLMADPTPLPERHIPQMNTSHPGETSAADQTATAEPETERRSRRVNVDEYASQFLSPTQPSAIRRGAYIDFEYHKKISTLVGVVGKRNLTVGSFIDTVLAKHFEQYGEEIKTLCSKQVNKIL